MKGLFYTLSVLFFYNSVMAQVDTTNGFTAPDKVSGSVTGLSQYLCEGLVSDTAKANMIFNWITHNIEYDIKAAKDPYRKEPTAQQVLKSRKTTCDGYSILFVEMCKTVGLDAVRVGGYAKNWMFDNGDQFYIPRHQWCAVKIDRRWELADPTSGAGRIAREPNWLQSQLNIFSKDDNIAYTRREVFEFHYNPAYFLPDPILFRATHLPEDPMWQLAKTHLPLDVFEAGDSAVHEFNLKNPYRIHRAPELEYIARLNDAKRIIEYSDRAYKFNDSFIAILATKEQLNANMLLARYLSHRNVPQRSALEDAYRGMVLAGQYLDTQKSYIADQYATLKKSNIDKSRIAKGRVRDISIYNKRMGAQCKRRVLLAERKQSVLMNRQDRTSDIVENISYDRIDSIKTISVEKDRNSTLLVTLSDSIRAKQRRLNKSNFSIIDKIQGITVLQEANVALLDSILIVNGLADTLLKSETMARLKFRDSYDDDVKTIVQLFDSIRFVRFDTLLKEYVQHFDTLAVYYEDLQKLYQDQARLYKSLLRDMVQYRRWNSKEGFVVSGYMNTSKKYSECLGQYQQTMEVYENYLDKNIRLFDTLISTFEQEETLLGKIDKAETARKDTEEAELNEQRNFDEIENEKLHAEVDKTLKELTDILSR